LESPVVFNFAFIQTSHFDENAPNLTNTFQSKNKNNKGFQRELFPLAAGGKKTKSKKGEKQT